MNKLFITLAVLLGVMESYAQSPHGERLKLDCAACHDPSGWTTLNKPLLFDHDTTSFPLSGVHTSTDCKACHSSLVFSEQSDQCITCHSDVHEMSLGTDCARCHSTLNWLVDDIPELHEESGFVILGAHENLSCISCHVSETNLRFDRLGNDCINCHSIDFSNATNPDHLSGGFSTNCTECHDPRASDWQSENQFHNFFPLVSSHDIPDCKRCHVTSSYSDASPECASCHLTDYNNTTNPNHMTAQFPVNCNVCHTIDAWVPAVIDHSFYPLLGGHAVIANNCNLCHNGNYINTPNTCVGCHLDDYNNVTNPNHATSQFSTDCTQCHNETAWTPANFDHDIFPIYSGKHKDEWNTCTDCHINTSNYSIFSCIDCHEHNNPGDLADEHDNVNGYAYNSAACFSCHPDGRK